MCGVLTETNPDQTRKSGGWDSALREPMRKIVEQSFEARPVTVSSCQGYSMPALIHRIVSLPRRMRADVD